MGRKSTRGLAVCLRGLITVMVVMTLTTAGWAGGQAANFTLPSAIDGKEISLSQFSGKVVVLNFITFVCGPCRDEMPDLNRIYLENSGKGLVVIGIGLSSQPADLRFLAKQLGLNYPLLVGTDKVSQDYGGVDIVPTTFIIDRGGNIAHKITGARSKEHFEKLIRPML
jgi:cytochrome c biogenesis protein CcmG/thiol:disulfide interchange protein DsbE